MSDIVANVIAGTSLIGSIFSLVLSMRALGKADEAIKTEKLSHLILIYRTIIDEIDQWNIEHEKLWKDLCGENYEFGCSDTPENFNQIWNQIYSIYLKIVERLESTYPTVFNGAMKQSSHKVWNNLTDLKINSFNSFEDAEYIDQNGVQMNYWADAEGILFLAHSDVIHGFRGGVVTRISKIVSHLVV